MRRSYKSFMLLLVMAFMLSGTAVVEASSVTYVNQAERFVFVPIDTDLFENFKGVMPGDKRTQKIDVGNDSEVPVKIYLKISPVTEEDEAFLKQLKLIIEDSEEVLFEEMLHQQGEFSEFILLRQLEPGKEMTMDLTLEVPLSMTNDFMNQEAQVEWIFKVEEITGNLPDTENPEPPIIDPPILPATGAIGEGIWFMQGILSIMAGGYLLKRKTL
ncbi:MAG TPA: hypothetical protein VLM88_12540 [Proteiniclasticum sp.]|nr:hypothetical protein [Proteiniclasticum sp.]